MSTGMGFERRFILEIMSWIMLEIMSLEYVRNLAELLVFLLAVGQEGLAVQCSSLEEQLY